MNSLKKDEVVPLLNFEEGPVVPLLNLRGVPGPNFKLWEGSRGPAPTVTPCLDGRRHGASRRRNY